MSGESLYLWPAGGDTRLTEKADLPVVHRTFGFLLLCRRDEVSHQRHHLLMMLVDLEQRRAFGACAPDRAEAIGVRIESGVP